MIMEDDQCVDAKQISQAACTILKVAEKTCKADLTNPLEQQAVNLQLCFKKIPNVKNNAIIKIHLPTPVTHSVSDVCLFVKDVDVSDRDSDPTIRHYKELLESKGIKQHIEVIPLKLLKLEYQPYEAKRNLSNMYDVFLADDRIVRLLPRYLGKHFLSRKKFPMQVNLQAKDLKKEIDKVLSTTQCVLTGRGSNCQVTVARTGMSANQIAKNIQVAVLKLTNHIPGGAANVRNIHIKTASSPSLPIFLSLSKRDNIMLPKIETQSELIEPEDVTPVRGALVKISKFGRIQLIKTPEDDEEVQEEKAEKDEDEGPLLEGSEDEEDKSDDEVTHKDKKRRQVNNKPSQATGKRARSPDSDEEEEQSSDEDSKSDEADIIQNVQTVKSSKVKKTKTTKSKGADNTDVTRGKKRKLVAGDQTKSPKKTKVKVTDTELSNKKRKTEPSSVTAVEQSKSKKRTDKESPEAQIYSKSPNKSPKSSSIVKSGKSTPTRTPNKSMKSATPGKSTPTRTPNKSMKSATPSPKTVKSGKGTTPKDKGKNSGRK